jgi:hypothetical protein
LSDEPRDGAPQLADNETSVYPVTVGPVAASPFEHTGPVVAPPPAPSGAQIPPVSSPVYPPYAPVAYGRAPHGTAGRVVFAGVVLFVFGLGEALGGAVAAVAATTLRKLFDQLLRNAGLRIEAASVTSVLTGVFVTVLVLGIVHMMAAGGVFAHRGWGRWLGIVLGLIGTIVGVWLTYRVAAADGRFASYVAPLAILIPYGLTLLALLFPGDHFRRGARAGRSN